MEPVTIEQLLNSMKILRMSGDSIFDRITESLDRGLKKEARQQLDFVDLLLEAMEEK